MIDISTMNLPFNKIPIICGPTGSGKSGLALKLCELTNGELVSCDSMQIYKKLDVGTAKATKTEQAIVPHHMLDIISPEQSYSVNDYVNDALPIISDILSRNKLPVICGGTGQYVSALFKGIRYIDSDSDTKVNDEVIRLTNLFEANELDINHIYTELCRIDPVASKAIHVNNTRRVIRAYAVYTITGNTFTQWNEESLSDGPTYPFALFNLERDRAELYDRINKRVDIMLSEGLENEAKYLYDLKLPKGTTSLQAIGYKEFIDYFDGKCSLDEAVYQIKLRSRHYAKRQLTWYRYIPEIIRIDAYMPTDDALDMILKEINYSK